MFQPMAKKRSEDQIRGAYKFRLREVRKDKGVTLYRAARMTGVSRISLAKYEAGDCEPGLQNLIRISVGMDVPISDLVTFDREAVLIAIANTPVVECPPLPHPRVQIVEIKVPEEAPTTTPEVSA